VEDLRYFSVLLLSLYRSLRVVTSRWREWSKEREVYIRRPITQNVGLCGGFEEKAWLGVWGI